MGQFNSTDSETPRCLCGAHNWISGGSSIGPGYCNMWRTCESCKRVALEAYRDGGNAFLIADGTDFSESQLDYINGTLSVVWRSRAAELEAYRNDRAQERLAAVNTSLGLPKDTRGDTVPSHRYREWSEALDAEADAWMAAMPAALRLAPIPPQLPGDVSAYVRNRGEREWVHVDSFASLALPVPPDPRRVEHDKRYAQLFSRLRENLPVEFNVKAIPNGYFDDKFDVEPWYSLSFAEGFEIVVGARKRVIEVTLKTSNDRLDTSPIEAIGKRDGVTFSTNSSGGMLHAWGTEKAFEYVGELYRTATEK